jgi:AraC-like DNA-binding protein
MVKGAGAGQVVTRFSTLPLPAVDRLPRWEAWNRDSMIALQCQTRGGEGLRGDEINLALPQLQVARVRAEGHRVARREETIERSPAGGFVLYLALRGHATFADRRSSARLAPGQVLLIDADRPFERSFADPFAELALKISHEAYAEQVGAVPPLTPAVTTLAGPAAVRAQVVVRSLASAAAHALGALDDQTLQTIALDLLGNLTTSPEGGDRLTLARGLVDQHLADSSLSATALAGLLGVSDRQLSRLFASSGTTFPRYLTARRLDRAVALLAEPSHSVTQVARMCGFASASYFIRVFRDRFGATPRHSRG